MNDAPAVPTRLGDAETNGARVFISYSRRDGAVAEWLRDALREQHFDAYLDVHDIAPGEAWQERLNNLIANADKVLFLISPDSVASPVCGWEVDCAERLGKSLLPVLIRETPTGDVPGRLQRLNFVFMRDPSERTGHMPLLVDALMIDLAWEREKARINDDAMAWDRAGRPNRLLLFAEDAIRTAEAWRDARPPTALAATGTQLAFIVGSRARRTRLQRRIAVISVIVSVITAVSAVIALVQWRAAERNALEAAQRAAILSTSVAEGLAEDGSTDEALVMLLEAARNFPSDATPDALLIAFDRAILRAHREERFAVAAGVLAFDTPAGLLLHDPARGALLIFDGTAPPRPIGTLPGRMLAIKPTLGEPGLLAVLETAATLTLFRVDPGNGGTIREIGRISGFEPERGTKVQISASGIVHATGSRDGKRRATLYDTRSGKRAELTEAEADYDTIAVDAQGHTVLLPVTTTGDAQVRVLELAADLSRTVRNATERQVARLRVDGCLGVDLGSHPRISSLAEALARRYEFEASFQASCQVRGDGLMVSVVSNYHAGNLLRSSLLFDLSRDQADPVYERETESSNVMPAWWLHDQFFTVADPSFQDVRLYVSDLDGYTDEPRSTVRESTRIDALTLSRDTELLVLRTPGGPGAKAESERRLAVYHLDPAHEYAATHRAADAVAVTDPSDSAQPLLRPMRCFPGPGGAGGGELATAAGSLRLLGTIDEQDAPAGRAIEFRTRDGRVARRTELATPRGQLELSALCARLSPAGDWLLAPSGDTIRVFQLGAGDGAGSELPPLAPGAVTSADFFAAGPSVITTNASGAVTLWEAPREPNRAWTDRPLYAGKASLRFAQSDRAGKRLLLVEDHGGGEHRGVLYSLDAGRVWRAIGVDVQGLQAEFAPDGSVRVWHWGRMTATYRLHSAKEAVAAAQAELALECRPIEPGNWRSSPCWPPRYN